MKIILASGSPRRKELLSRAGIEFDVIVSETDETVSQPMKPSEHALEVSKRKADAVIEICKQNNITQAKIIAADTIVCVDEKILGKPKNKSDAIYMLELLEGRWHEVYTGCTVIFWENNRAEHEQIYNLTKVKFKPLTSHQIEEYVNTKEPFGKAGAYAIQGEGGKLIEKIDGDYNNVVGLPLDCVVKMLSRKC